MCMHICVGMQCLCVFAYLCVDVVCVCSCLCACIFACVDVERECVYAFTHANMQRPEISGYCSCLLSTLHFYF